MKKDKTSRSERLKWWNAVLERRRALITKMFKGGGLDDYEEIELQILREITVMAGHYIELF